jgi:recombination protein RecA
MAKVTKKEKEPKVESKRDSKGDQIDILANDVLAIINKQFKDHPDAMSFLKDANMVTDWISTGCDILDLAISNRSNGGLPAAKIVEFNGLEGSGKSLLAAHVMAECQKKGGIAVLYDIEGAVGMLDFYQSLGLNTDKLLYIDKLRTLEEVYSSMESIIGKTITGNKDIPLVIVLDSVTGATTIKELEEDYEKKGYATEKAKVNST